MKARNLISAAILSSAMFGLPASAQPGGFSTMQGIDAQALSTEEMQAVAGQLNAYDIAAALTAKAATQDAFPRLQDATLRLAAFVLANAESINAAFKLRGVYTDPK